MKTPSRWLLRFGLILSALTVAGAGPVNRKEGQNPAEHLPPHIQRVTWFGERADFSHDGKRILFVEKTFGDVYEVELATGIIRAMTHHYPHYGYTRALYLANGDILLSGPRNLNPGNPVNAPAQSCLYCPNKRLPKR